MQLLVRDLLEVVSATDADLRSAAAQDALDAIAVAEGLKPSAILGSGYTSPDFGAAFKNIPVRIASGPQCPSSSIGEFPSWYAEALDAHRLAHSVLIVSRLPTLPADALDASAEAAFLGYPLCCVQAFHRRQRLFHLLNIRAIRRQAAGDEAHMARLAKAQIVLTPRSAREQRLLATATRAVFAPLTSIAMCASCENGPDSPARRISRRYAEMVEQLGLQELARISAL